MKVLFFIISVVYGLKNRTQCEILSNWFGYTFLHNPLMKQGNCEIDHAGKTIQMSNNCRNLSFVECF